MARLLEALNAAAILPAVIMLALLTRYFSKESVRRGLHALDWFHLPPSMNLALAMFIFDAAVTLRLAVTVIWYATGQKIVPVQALFVAAIAAIIVGLLCKIRAITEPDHGRLPWIASMVVTIGAAALFLAFSRV